jgi:riboflavin synthase
MCGHLVSGHVNKISDLIKKEVNGLNHNLWFKIDSEDLKYILDEGSIAIDGVSLTIAKACEDMFMVTIIPHTLLNTTLGKLNVGDCVNLEFDLMAKYVENILRYKTEGKHE